MSRSKRKPELHLSSRHWLRKRLIIALVVVGVLISLIIASLRLVADRAAGDYTAAVTRQKAKVALDLQTLAELSKRQQGEMTDTAQLRDATVVLETSIAAYEPPGLENIPLGMQLSLSYQQARRDMNEYQNDVSRLKAVCVRLADFAGYNHALQGVFSSADLFASVNDEKTAMTREKSWRDAAGRLAALKTDEATQKAVASLLSNDMKGVAELLKATAAHFKAQDVSKVERDQAMIEKKIAALRLQAGDLAEFRHDLQQQLMSAVTRLD